MKVVRVKTMDPGVEGRELSNHIYVEPTIGAALDRHAPDPADQAEFRVEVIGTVRFE